MSRTYQFKWRSSLAILLFALLIALTGVVAASGTAEASDKTLSFDSPPTTATIKSGTLKKNVAKVGASGTDQKRIRYSISGNSAFKISKRNGRVSYDGRPLSRKSVRLTITARDTQGEYDSVSATLAVSVRKPTPKSSPSVQSSASQRQRITNQTCVAGMTLHPGDDCTGPGAPGFDAVNILSNGNAKVRSRCWLIATCSVHFKDTFISRGLNLERRAGNQWYIRAVSQVSAWWYEPC